MPTDYRQTDNNLRLVNGQTDKWMDGQTDGRTDATKYIISQHYLPTKCHHMWSYFEIKAEWNLY